MGLAFLQSARVHPISPTLLLLLSTMAGHVAVGVGQFAVLPVTSAAALVVSYAFSGHYSFHQVSVLIKAG